GAGCGERSEQTLMAVHDCCGAATAAKVPILRALTSWGTVAYPKVSVLCRRLAYRSEVGVTEAGSVFQPVAQAPIEGGMSREYQGEVPQYREAREDTDNRHHGGHGIAVDGVVKSRPRLPAHRIAGETEVRSKEKDGEYPELPAKAEEKRGARGEYRQCLYPKKLLYTAGRMAAVDAIKVRFPVHVRSCHEDARPRGSLLAREQDASERSSISVHST